MVWLVNPDSMDRLKIASTGGKYQFRHPGRVCFREGEHSAQALDQLQ